MRTLIKAMQIIRYHRQRCIVRRRYAAHITADITQRCRQLTGHCCCIRLSHLRLHCHWCLLTCGRSRAGQQQLTTTTTTTWSLLATSQQRHHSQQLRTVAATERTQQKTIFSPSPIHLRFAAA